MISSSILININRVTLKEINCKIILNFYFMLSHTAFEIQDKSAYQFFFLQSFYKAKVAPESHL